MQVARQLCLNVVVEKVSFWVRQGRQRAHVKVRSLHPQDVYQSAFSATGASGVSNVWAGFHSMNCRSPCHRSIRFRVYSSSRRWCSFGSIQSAECSCPDEKSSVNDLKHLEKSRCGGHTFVMREEGVFEESDVTWTSNKIVLECYAMSSCYNNI